MKIPLFINLEYVNIVRAGKYMIKPFLTKEISTRKIDLCPKNVTRPFIKNDRSREIPQKGQKYFEVTFEFL